MSSSHDDEAFDPKWDNRFIDLALHIALWSKDPSTKTGAVIVDNLRRVIGHGYNGFPRGVIDDPERYSVREKKYQLVVHAEANAILNATRSVSGATLYSTLYPCAECTKLIIQAGIDMVVVPRDVERWTRGNDIESVDVMVRESNLVVRRV